MSDGEQDVPVAEAVEVTPVNPFGAPQATSNAGTTRPREETWSSSVLISLSVGLVVTVTSIVAPIVLLGRVNSVSTQLFTWFVVLVLLGGLVAGILAGMFTLRKLATKHRVE